jgi:hypothetical protein
MTETIDVGTWRENDEIVAALDRLILKAAPELNTIMIELDKDQTLKQKAAGNMGIAFGFCVSLFTVAYERVRRTSADPLEAFDSAVTAIAAHPLTQDVVARSMSAVVDRQAKGLKE